MRVILDFILRFLSKPLKILLYGFLLLVLTLLLNNTLFDLWRLQHDNKHIQTQTLEFQKKTKLIKEKLRFISTSSFIKMKATENLDVAKEDEIIFVFTDYYSKAKP